MIGIKRKENSLNQEVKTLIGEGTLFEGNITVPPGLTRVDGEVLGNVGGNGGVLIGENGSVKGDITVDSLVVYGRVFGKIRAKSAEFRKGCRVEGSIEVVELYIEKGATYNGECRMGEGSPEASF